ncbi:hypothetical protein QS306_14485 [Paraburkholderia bonniea]|uniref:hypothetical protein n=1 Tax=Paraburkholderia bonniea TaxID=2152891 RepID=UPI0012929130|nr:hypothetical protein [Paraburkholderia bonniea]WJF91976.1 hypothetical protein QS306_14485 [Paraburkholderia bonniea]WJF95295.1 hypothetical protein QS308_14490 [Paraburkholderia bonniea]
MTFDHGILNPQRASRSNSSNFGRAMKSIFPLLRQVVTLMCLDAAIDVLAKFLIIALLGGSAGTIFWIALAVGVGHLD